MTKKSDPVFSSMDDVMYDRKVYGEDLYAHALNYIVEHCFDMVYIAEHRAYLIGAYTSLLAYNQAINICNERTESYPNTDDYLDDIIKTGMSRWLFTISAVKSICGLELSRNTFLITLFSNSTSMSTFRRPMVAAIYRYIKMEQENIQKELDALQTKNASFTKDEADNYELGNLLKDFLSACEGIDMAAYAHRKTTDDEKYTAFKKALTRIMMYSNAQFAAADALKQFDKKEGEES